MTTCKTQSKIRRENVVKYLRIFEDCPGSEAFDIVIVSDAAFARRRRRKLMSYAAFIIIKDTLRLKNEEPYRGYYLYHTAGSSFEAYDSGNAEKLAILKAARATSELLLQAEVDNTLLGRQVLIMTDYMGFCTPHTRCGAGIRSSIYRILPGYSIHFTYMGVKNCLAMATVDKHTKIILNALRKRNFWHKRATGGGSVKTACERENHDSTGESGDDLEDHNQEPHSQEMAP